MEICLFSISILLITKTGLNCKFVILDLCSVADTRKNNSIIATCTIQQAAACHRWVAVYQQTGDG